MKSYSQAGQDLFVHALRPKPGLYLDVGAAGLSISNTLGLEEIGWTGWLIDNSVEAQRASANRLSRFFCEDATGIHYEPFTPSIMDYGSFDIDGATLAAMCRVFETAPGTRFRVLTCEHDFYARGDTLRTPMLKLLQSKGYDILCSDVCHEGKSFEIWAVHPDLVDMSIANKFRRDKPTEWKEILGL